MTSRIRDWQPGKVLVVGDVMLDQYWHGQTRRISPEAPVPIVKVEQQSERVGGAANVAANIIALDVPVELIGGVGCDAAGKTLTNLCEKSGIVTHFISGASARTTVKLRVLSQHQQLLRLDFESTTERTAYAGLVELFNENVSRAEVVVLSDYGKGLLHDCQSLIKAANASGKRVIVDPKSNDFSRYAGAYLVTPNYSEFEACVGKCQDENEIIERGIQLCEIHNIEGILVTRGENGMTLISPRRSSLTLAAKSRDVFDVTGAGDTVCAVLASALASGHDLDEAIAFANAAAGLVVGKIGTASVSRAELEGALGVASESSSRVMSLESLRLHVDSARARRERVVMTNGCFDVLHAGHVHYLEQAKALGNRLVVAINSDSSVRRLKGEGRPIHNLQNRMNVIAALASVDWVVSFNEDTPLSLIKSLQPDVLVKGGDYSVEQIVGKDEVTKSGGEVLVLPFSDGLSTTAILERISARRP
jgi:D-beta-D-heptose 7-phosphate kinase/D-beta-D-heptose 1-phosphate adenosyltransferase